jgi:mannonate dehydratase
VYLGSQVPYDLDTLRFLRQMGVTHVDVTPDRGLGVEEVGHWHMAPLLALREQAEAQGLTLAAMHLPLSSAGIERQAWPHIMLGGPERDREIEQVQRTIAAAGRAGIPLLLYNLAILPVVRTAYRTPGRGGVTYSHFDYDELAGDPPHPNAPVTAEQAWERISDFVARVVPVAEEYGVRLGCHPHDPGMPAGRGYRGIERVLGSVEGLKRFVALSDSPYHGLNFCQGTVAEMCTAPEQVYEAIRYFGSRDKIFWVHFRNIRGGYLRFDEVFPDEGSIDMVKAMRIYKEVGYDGVFVPDHVPQSEIDPPPHNKARAFCLGYIRALIQAVESEG